MKNITKLDLINLVDLVYDRIIWTETELKNDLDNEEIENAQDDIKYCRGLIKRMKS